MLGAGHDDLGSEKKYGEGGKKESCSTHAKYTISPDGVQQRQSGKAIDYVSMISLGHKAG